MKINISELAGDDWPPVISYCGIHINPNVDCNACLEYLSRKRISDACDLTLEVDYNDILKLIHSEIDDGFADIKDYAKALASNPKAWLKVSKE